MNFESRLGFIHEVKDWRFYSRIKFITYREDMGIPGNQGVFLCVTYNFFINLLYYKPNRNKTECDNLLILAIYPFENSTIEDYI